MDQKLGSWAFIVGAVIAVLAGVFASTAADYAAPIALLLVILGLAVGFLNVSPKEATSFIIAAVGLIVAGTGNLLIIDTVVAGLGSVLESILTNIGVFLAPAVVIVGLKTIYDLAKEA